MTGVLMCILSGAAMSVQGVFNTRLSDKIGLLESNLIVQAIAVVLAAISLFWAKGSFSQIGGVNKLYLTGGVLAMVITVTVMLGIKNLSPTIAISIILVSQLAAAALIDAFGLFDSERVVFGIRKIIGLAVMIGGIILFSYKK
ncbi:MAG: DMT family transporter [Eubacteriales bacterium]|nr:DMT family transporter [Eubacteriales bacterium]